MKNVKKYNDKFRKSKKGVVSSIYFGQKGSSKSRGHRLPEYSIDELSDWLYSQVLFHKLYSEWVHSGFKKRLKPSVDRKHDELHYCMNNIQLMTWGENNTKSHLDRRSGISESGKRCRAIVQHSEDMEIVEIFHSGQEAERKTGIKNSAISNNLHMRSRHAGGYIWKYVNDSGDKS